MNISAKVTDERVLDVRFDAHSLIVDHHGWPDDLCAARLVSAFGKCYSRTA